MIHKKKNLLAKYLEEEGIMKSVFARKIGVSVPTLLMILKSTRTPRLETAYKIEEVTHGCVPVVSWLNKAEK